MIDSVTAFFAFAFVEFELERNKIPMCEHRNEVQKSMFHESQQSFYEQSRA